MTQNTRTQRTIKKARIHTQRTLRWGSFAASSWSAAQLPCGCSRTRPAGVSGWRVCNTRTLGGKGGKLPGTSRAWQRARGRAMEVRERIGDALGLSALVCLSKGVSRWVAQGSRKDRRVGVLQGVRVPARAGIHRGRQRGDRCDGGVPHELEHSFFVCVSLCQNGESWSCSDISGLEYYNVQKEP